MRKQTGQARLTVGLLADLVAVLRKHGYRLPADKDGALRAMGATVANVIRLATAFEGQPYSELPERNEFWRMGLCGARIANGGKK
ncbi:hypothetical protein [Lentzea albida]|uniref:Uncharacterized protein n=1 Tax=Lentzea albida TaxID=65499 RepID=A0A1H9VI47_9PSEU|nr:hypothetical protein [Lentzea albida]SES21322.1 hypothetical protein SAMN04488000_118140 [Lentzea albida]